MNSSRHNEVAAEPRQFKVGTKACRVEAVRREDGVCGELFARVKKSHLRQQLLATPFFFVGNGAGARTGLSALL